MTNSLGRKHWTHKKRETDLLKRLVYNQCHTHKLINLKLHRALLTLTRYSSSEPDFDGLVSGFKHVLDGLVDAGVIVNDKPSVIGSPSYLWRREKPGLGYITVRIDV